MADLVRRLVAPLADVAFPGLPPATHRVRVRRDLAVPMADGVQLLADLHEPVGATGAPTIVMRSPYGRTGLHAALLAWPLAQRGYPVLVQSVRGTFGSGGVFTPQVHERSDGTDTLRWVRRQPWFTGTLVTTGMSYLGYAQWAVAGHLQRDEPETAPDAVCLQITMPDFGAITWENGAFTLRTALGWTRMVDRQERVGSAVLGRIPSPALERGYAHLPLDEADRVALGHTSHWYQDWVSRDDLSDPYWTQQSHTGSVADVTAPVSMITGWYDIFLPWQVANHATLVAAGNPPQLTIGPWGHVSTGLHRSVPAEVHEFLSSRLAGRPSSRSHRVRVFVTGVEQWRGYETWPPAGVELQPWSLQPGGGLTPGAGQADGASSYVYDPADPTPALGGPSLLPECGPVDNATHEQRADVLVFTSEVLTGPLEVQGTPAAVLQLRSDQHCTDVFVRICDVHPDGRSMTVCDGLRRIGGRGTVDLDPVAGPDGVREVRLELWPTAHRFLSGHRVRVQVSSGAHPRYARNPGGDGRHQSTERELHVAHQQVLHGPGQPSRVELPVVAL